MIFFVYIGYPILTAFFRLFHREEVDRSEEYKPMVTIIIPAYNEEKFIGRKIINTLNLEYPREKLEIIIGVDGSTDNTAKIAKGYERTGVKVYYFEKRRGKISIMNDLSRGAVGEIIIFSDANTFYRSDSLNKIVRNFYDERVGVVCGRLTLEKGNYSSVTKPELIYWDYEHILKILESESGSTVGVVGSIYAVRKELLEDYPEDTILDDLEIALSVIKKGYRVIYDQEAEARETMVSSTKSEFERKVRLVSGGFRTVFRNMDIFFMGGVVGVRLLFHKFLRWLIPINLIVIFLYSLFSGKKRRKLLLFQAVFYLSPLPEIIVNSIKQLFSGKRDIKIKWAYIPFYFVMINFSALVGFVKFILNKQSVKWKMTRDD